MKIAKISCFVSSGLFKRERCVRIELPDMKHVIALVDESAVECEFVPGVDEEFHGFLYVFVMAPTKPKSNEVLVGLPIPNTTFGSERFWVPSSMIQPELQSEEKA